MMEPIFISIDDNEVANLRALMDKVFGETNFIATVIWQKNFSPNKSAKWASGDLSARNPYSKGIYSITCPDGRQSPPGSRGLREVKALITRDPSRVQLSACRAFSWTFCQGSRQPKRPVLTIPPAFAC